MRVASAVMTSKGQTTIPKAVRSHLRLEAGDRLESGAEEYRWVNRTLFVGRGRGNDGIEYEVSRLA